jgi:Fic family protein
MYPLKTSDRLKPTLRELLDEKLAKLKKLRPIAPTLLQKLKERFQIEMTYNSNAIEGNTLTLNETYWVFQEGITVKGKSLREHLEVKDHKKALERLYQLVESPTPIRISESVVKDLHHAVVELSEESSDQGYRKTKVLISGSKHTPIPHEEISSAMKSMLRWADDRSPDLHAIEFAAILHHRFVHIHPFLDGNGRTARLLMNLMLMKEGYPLVIILKNDRMKYYRALRAADNGRYKALIQFIAQAAIRALNLYLEVLVSSREKPKFISLSDATRFCEYSQEYLSKLSKEGRLDAHKQNRNWVTTKEAVQDYIKQHGYAAQ